MIDKIKLTAAIIVLFIIAILLGLYALERSKNCSLQKDQARLLEKLRLLELRKKISQSPVKEIKNLHRKDAKDAKNFCRGELHSPENSGQGSATLAKPETCPDPCQVCFREYQYQIEVKDEEGRWIFKDENIFDDHPGSLTLTDRFWQELENGKPAEKIPEPAPKLPRLKNRVLIGAELDQYKIEYAYSPLGIRTNKMELDLNLYSSLSMTYTSSPLEARAGIGLEIRF